MELSYQPKRSSRIHFTEYNNLIKERFPGAPEAIFKIKEPVESTAKVAVHKTASLSFNQHSIKYTCYLQR